MVKRKREMFSLTRLIIINNMCTNTGHKPLPHTDGGGPVPDPSCMTLSVARKSPTSNPFTLKYLSVKMINFIVMLADI